jgi:protein-L-isoaspartate(D-aspartate) O-methyltransferase
MTATRQERSAASDTAAARKSSAEAAPSRSAARWSAGRAALLKQIAERGDIGALVLAAMNAVPRERFIPEPWRGSAYDDRALPIERDQTISQPYIVALMTQLAEPGPGKRILEVGTGSGYQTAVLAATGAEVYSVEIIESLAQEAAQLLAALGVRCHTRVGDGHQGWPEQAPFDAIVVTAAPLVVPRALIEQLSPGGRLVVPVGERDEQSLVRILRTSTGFETEVVTAVRFVPMTGGSGASFVPG